MSERTVNLEGTITINVDINMEVDAASPEEAIDTLVAEIAEGSFDLRECEGLNVGEMRVSATVVRNEEENDE